MTEAKKVAMKICDDLQFWVDDIEYTKRCALILVQNVINANPHSNPLNTEVHSTMDFWLDVQKEIENLILKKIT